MISFTVIVFLYPKRVSGQGYGRFVQARLAAFSPSMRTVVTVRICSAPDYLRFEFIPCPARH